MLIKVKVKPQAKFNKVEKIGDNDYKVWVTSAPEKGKANQAVIKLLAEFLKLPKSSFKIIKGETGKDKILEVV